MFERVALRCSKWSLSKIVRWAALIALLLGVAAVRSASAALIPPSTFVMAADGATPLSLEQAGILNADGRRWAVILGKALFWEQQAGSDGQACASCHFHAGADTRLTNQLNPGFNDITKGPNGDTVFGSEQSDTGEVPSGFMPSGHPAGANYTLLPADLPLHKLVDEANRNSLIRTTTNDRISSMGTAKATFLSGQALGAPDHCAVATDSIFKAGAFAARQVEPRNAPPVFNAVFNNRNFWDGRANNLFNGVGVFGMRDILGDPNKRLIVLDSGGHPRLGYLQVENASLASQALAPPVNAVEMSCGGRNFADVARRLFLTVPLLKQRVDPNDSVLGPFASSLGKGLSLPYVYPFLIGKAFDKKYWSAPGLFGIKNGKLVNDPHGFSQIEMNFSMFWGISIMLYESTLVSDQSEFDSLVASGDLITVPPAPFPDCITSPNVDPLLARGCKIFHRAPFDPRPPADGIRGVGCALCHSSATFSEAAAQAGDVFTPFLNPVPDINNVLDIRDLGFANVGLRPVFSDVLLGGTDPYGNPLSFARQYKTGVILDPFLQRAIAGGAIQPNIVDGSVSKLETDGATKIPTLRNVALTPPYFSWGGYESLRQVLKVYNRGFNRRDITSLGSIDAHGSNCSSGDTSGTGPGGNQHWPLPGPDCNTNTTGLIVPLGLLDCDANGQANPACAAQGRDTTNDDLAALQRYMISLTDRRVQCDSAPFDHPELYVVVGHRTTDTDHDGRADDILFDFPAVGASGFSPSTPSYCIPNAGTLFEPGMQSRSGGTKVSIN
jgi:cytochrome c peroxidase